MPAISFSMGSSTVRMRRSGELIILRNAPRVVDLPEPVGPVTRMIPWGLRMTGSTFFRSSARRPSCSRVNSAEPWLSRRRLTLSPKFVGNVETRISMSLMPLVNFIRPS